MPGLPPLVADLNLTLKVSFLWFYRERLIEEERAALQTKRQEELRTQIRAIMDGMMLDVKKDVLQCLQEQISEERQKIKGLRSLLFIFQSSS